MVDYRHLAKLVNWQCNPVTSSRLGSSDCNDSRATGTVIGNVDLDTIIKDIGIFRPTVPHPCDAERQKSNDELVDRERDNLRHDDHHEHHHHEDDHHHNHHQVQQ